MHLHRSRSSMLLALLALVLQLLVASGLARAADHCASMSMPVPEMSADCHGHSAPDDVPPPTHCGSAMCTATCVAPAALPVAQLDLTATVLVRGMPRWEPMQPELGSCLNDLLRPPRAIAG